MTAARGAVLPRAYAAGAIAVASAAVLLLVRPSLAAIPLAAFVLLSLVATQLPTWSYFLPIALHGPRSRREVALTFDDGPDPRTLPALLELLAAAGAPATFFVVGRRAQAHPGAIRAILDAGHTLGNHSHSHDVFLAARGAARIRREILACQAALAPMGVRPRCFRPPVGVTSPPVANALRGLDLRCVCFSCRPLDLGNRRLAGLARRVLGRVRPGDIILLHDLLPAGAPLEAWRAEVAQILAGLRERGLAVVPLERLLGAEVMDRLPGAPDVVGSGRPDAPPARAEERP
jgi:peptidoglycan/xylan/chitin deacetylase (PgdA/CDA1 family)